MEQNSTLSIDDSLLLNVATPAKTKTCASQSSTSCLSPTLLDLIKPLRKGSTREAEEVRITKLYRHVLLLLGSSSSESSTTTSSSTNESSIKSLLESIVRSYLLVESHNLPAQLKSIKFASLKLLSGICTKLGHGLEAYKLINRALKLDKNDFGLWLRMTRTATRLGRFETARHCLETILCEHPCHPAALPLSLPFYFAISEFESCLEVCSRSLKLDPLNQFATCLVQRIIQIQPCLDFLIQDILLSRPEILSEEIPDNVRNRLDNEVNSIRTRYLAQLQAIADRRKIRIVDFPKQLSELTWSNLLEATIALFDEIQQTPHQCIVRISSLIPTDVAELVVVNNTLSESHQPDTTNSKSPSKDNDDKGSCSHVTIQPTQLGEDQPPSTEAIKEVAMEVDDPKPLPVTPSTEDISSKPTESVEKRRSSRQSRLSLDLTDGVNSYNRHKRFDNLTELSSKKQKKLPASDHHSAVDPHNPDQADVSPSHVDRDRLGRQFDSLLPQVVHDLAQLHADNWTSSPTTASNPASSRNNNSPSNEDSPNQLPVNESASDSSSSPWSANSVLEFLKLFDDYDVNIAAFGVALVLQTAQLQGRKWSIELINHFIALYQRIWPTLPCSYTTAQLDPSPMTSSDQDSVSTLLPLRVLHLTQSPSFDCLLNLHLTYVELKLEQGDHQRSKESFPTLVDSRHRNPASNKDDDSISHDILYNALTLINRVDENSSLYAKICAHWYWINYLLASSSQGRDLFEMKDWLSTLQDHLEVSGISIPRPYSAFHGDLTKASVNQLVNHIDTLSSQQNLLQLSHEGNHVEVIDQMLELSKVNRSLFVGTREDRSVLSKESNDCLKPNQFILQFSATLNDAVNLIARSSQKPKELLVKCYLTSIILLDLVSDAFVRPFHQQITSSSVARADSKDLTDFDIKAWFNLLTQIFNCLIRSWYQITMIPIKSSSSLSDNCVPRELSALVNYPIQLRLDNSDGGDQELSAEFPEDDRAVMPFLGLVCHATRLLVQLASVLTTISTKAFDSNHVTSMLSLRFTACVYEHLQCIEQSLPPTMLSLEHQFYLNPSSQLQSPPPDTVDFQLNATAGTLPAPPRLHWLHLMLGVRRRQTNEFGDETSLKLLRQLVNLCSDLLIDNLEPFTFTQPDLLNVALSRASTGSGCHESPSKSSKSSSSFNSNDGVDTGSSQQYFIDAPRPNDNHNQTVIEKEADHAPSLALVLLQAVQRLLTDSSLLTDNNEGYELARPLSPLFLHVNRQLGDELVHIGASVGTSSALFRPWLQTMAELVNKKCHLQQQSQLQQTDTIHWWPTTVVEKGDDNLEYQQPSGKPAEQEEDWQCLQTVFLLCCPRKMPEFDSVKTLSISGDMVKLLSEGSKLMPSDERDLLLSPDQVEAMMSTPIQSDDDASNLLGENPTGLSDLTSTMFYLIADYYLKIKKFDLAIKYYLEDLRACPNRFDTWAALALIYHSELDQTLNMTSGKNERVAPDAVDRCLRCFTVALSLLPNYTTLLIERGCLSYQLHSYAARLVKKSVYRQFPDQHVLLCRQWRLSLLRLSSQSYERALVGMTSTSPTRSCPSSEDVHNSSSDSAGDEQEDEWLCHFMLGKCAEKSDRLDASGDHGPMSILARYRQAFDALDASGAKYPKRIILYNKLPFRAVEAIEVFYRIHAYIVKLLLRHVEASSSPTRSTNKIPEELPLEELYRFLLDIHSSEFVSAASKPKPSKSRKRSALVAGLGQKAPPAKLAAHTTHKPQEPAHAESETDNTAMITDHDPEDVIDLTTTSPDQSPVKTSAHPPISSAADERSLIDAACSTIREKSKKEIGHPSGGTITSGAINDPDVIDLTTTPDQLPDKVDPPNIHSSLVQDAKVDRQMSVVEKTNKARWNDCIELCRLALELVLQRLPLHYKAMYRLADLYLRADSLKNSTKAINLIFGPLEGFGSSASKTGCNVTGGGLFKDRKQNNFFHGVWRIPTADIDRSGNFAAHMYRSVKLALQVLSQWGEWRQVMHIFHQLRKQPPEDKRGFLGESDRIYLARHAFSLLPTALVNWLQSLISSSNNTTTYTISVDTLFQIFRLHLAAFARRSTASIPSPVKASSTSNDTSTRLACTREAVESTGYGEPILLAYRQCPNAWDSSSVEQGRRHCTGDNNIEDILHRCLQLLTISRGGGGGGPSTATSVAGTTGAVSEKIASSKSGSNV